MLSTMRRFDKFHFVLLFCVTLLLVALYHSHRGYTPVKFSKEKEEEYINAVKGAKDYSANPDEFIKNLVSYKKDTPLVWIGGVPRSGTTLARAILDAHPDVRCGEETRIIPRALAMHSKTASSQNEMMRLGQAHITLQLLQSALASYMLTIIAGHGEPAPLLCNKDPFALRSMRTIGELFPNSKFILMIRDGRAVSHSIITRHITIKGFDMKNIRGSLNNWNTAFTTMLTECLTAGPQACLPVYYERLVLQPREQTERIAKFLNIKWDDILLHHEKAIGQKGGISLSNKEPSTNQVNKPINADALYKWTSAIPPDVLVQIDSLAPTLRLVGYDTRSIHPDYSKNIDPVAERDFNELRKRLGV